MERGSGVDYMERSDNKAIEKIAIIGMAGRFPGAGNVDQFWRNLRDGRDCVTRFSDEVLESRGVARADLNNPNYVKAGLVLDNVDGFDAAFFGYNARDAELIDPQQRIFLEVAWDALENAGCNPDAYGGLIGVFGGVGSNDYVKRLPGGRSGAASGLDAFQTMLSNDTDFLSTRIAYKLNLKGPALSVQTACSTSLVAVHMGCQNLLTHQCDIALAGGVAVRLPQGVGYTYHEGMLWSPDGYCRAFDAKAQGTVFGRGAGVVVLKRLSEAIEEGDTIYAVIRGSAINNDGSNKVGFTAPSIDGQAQVVSMAQRVSNTPPETIDYVEAHGTGTKLGDPIEVEALTQAFRQGTDKTGYCGIGSVKTNIGHLDAAAGVASLIKTALALHYREIPASLHFETPNPDIDFDESPFYVVQNRKKWDKKNGPRRAGVSSFGVGGTNAHVVLEEAPSANVGSGEPASTQLIVLSAKTEGALQDRTDDLCNYLRANPEASLSNIAYTLQTGRKHFRYRKAVACRDIDQAIAALEKTGGMPPTRAAASLRNKKIVFMFSGQGSQYPNMCRMLYDEAPLFRDQIDDCSEKLKAEMGLDLRSVLFPGNQDESDASLLDQTWITQPALFAVEYSLARLLMDWGLKPAAMVGHSIGEYVAACIAGVFSLTDALALVAGRGRMIQDLNAGSMLAVPLAEEELTPLLPRGVSVAVTNAPQMTVVSGETQRIEAFRDQLSTEEGLACRIVRASHAFHSEMMDPIVDRFETLVAAFTRKPPRIRFASNLTGTWITEAQAVSPEYWAHHLRRTVRFHECMTTLTASGFRNFIEVGPGQTLALFAKRHHQIGDSLVLPTTPRPMDRGDDDASFLLNSLGQAWTSGIELNWQRVHQGGSGYKVPLPTYPFQRKRHWIESDVSPPVFVSETFQEVQKADDEPAAKEKRTAQVQLSRNDVELQISSIFCELLGCDHVDVRDSFFDIGGDSLLAAHLLERINTVSGGGLYLADVFEYPSVETLSERILSGGGRLRSTVIALNHSSSNHLVYFVVGIQIYQALAQRLTDTARCYGTFLPVEETLFDVGMKSSEWTVTDLAAAYRREIVRHAEGRPVSIVGVSFGGVVGYELARQLSEDGVEIPLLVMLDSLLPSGIHRNYCKWAVSQVSSMAHNGPRSVFRKLKKRLSSYRQKRVRRSRAVRMPDGGMPDQRLAVYADAVDWFEALATTTTYAGRTLLIQARDGVRFPGYTIDPHFGWKKHLSGDFHIGSVPGDHLGILKQPNVELTAELIQRVLSDIVRTAPTNLHGKLPTMLN